MLSQLRRAVLRTNRSAVATAGSVVSRRVSTAAVAVAMRQALAATAQRPHRAWPATSAAAVPSTSARAHAVFAAAARLRVRGLSTIPSAPGSAEQPTKAQEAAAASAAAGAAGDDKVDPLAAPEGGLSSAQVHEMQQSFGKNIAQRLVVGVGLTTATTAGFWAAGLLGAHPILVGVLNLLPTMGWSMTYSTLIGTSQLITRSLLDYGALRMVLLPLLQAVPARATDSVDHFLIALHREAKAMHASPTPGFHGFMEKQTTKFLDLIMKQLPSRIQTALDDLERERGAPLQQAQAQAAEAPAAAAAAVAADATTAGAAGSAGAGSGAAGASGRASPANVEPKVLHEVVLRVAQQLMVEQIAVYQRRTHVLLWGVYSCYIALMTYGLWLLKHRRDRKAKDKAHAHAKPHDNKAHDKAHDKAHEPSTVTKAAATVKAAGAAVSGAVSGAVHSASDKVHDLAAAAKQSKAADGNANANAKPTVASIQDVAPPKHQ